MVWRLLRFGALALSLAIVVAFERRSGSLAQFEGAIRRLGRGNMDDEIRLDGPSDMRFIGRRLEWLRRRLRGLESQRNQFCAMSRTN
jgi:two-component system sensor histidine kinase GlrK